MGEGHSKKKVGPIHFLEENFRPEPTGIWPGPVSTGINNALTSSLCPECAP